MYHLLLKKCCNFIFIFFFLYLALLNLEVGITVGCLLLNVKMLHIYSSIFLLGFFFVIRLVTDIFLVIRLNTIIRDGNSRPWQNLILYVMGWKRDWGCRYRVSRETGVEGEGFQLAARPVQQRRDGTLLLTLSFQSVPLSTGLKWFLYISM
ncbi:hypothetical protein ACSBR2_033467 [Camellia fascicularis]